MDSSILMPQFTDLSTPQRWNEVCLTLSSLHTLSFFVTWPVEGQLMEQTCQYASDGSKSGVDVPDEMVELTPKGNILASVTTVHTGCQAWNWNWSTCEWHKVVHFHFIIMLWLFYTTLFWVFTLCLHQVWQQVNEWMSLNKHIWMCNESYPVTW